MAFLYDLLGASQEHMIKPKKFAQTYIDEVILGHSVAGDTPIPFRHHGTPGWATMTSLHQRFGQDVTGLEVLAHDFGTGATEWTPVKRVFRHRFTGTMMATSQKWGAVETTPNHSIYGRDGEAFYPADRHEIMAVRKLGGSFVAERPTDAIDVLEGVAGFVRDAVAVTAVGGRMTRPCEPGWARLDLPRHSTAVRAVYDPIVDVQPLKDLITVLVWYATEGHVNGRNGGIVITQADPAELERVRAAYARVTTGRGSIDAGAKTDSAWRLYCGSQAIARVVEHHCGRLSPHKRLPDFLFSLPTAYLQHAFDELMRTDGSRKLSAELDATCSDTYRAAFFEYKTISPVLAAQVGTLASLLGHDYGVYRGERAGKLPTYRVRFCSGAGKRGGRHTTFRSRLHERPAVLDENGLGEWVYDIECIGLHNFVCGVGNVVASNTNEPEYKKLQGNEMMEAFRDRTIKIDVPVQHPARRRGADLQQGLRHRADQGHARRPAHGRGGGHVGRADPAGRAEEGGHHQDAKIEAVQRQIHPRIYRGQHQGAEGGGPAGGHAGHQPAVHPGQDQQRARLAPGPDGEGDQPVHGHERAGGGVEPPQR